MKTMENDMLFASPEETEKFGESLGKQLPAGSVVAISGELGAGKTVLAKGIAKGLGVGETITSPTFTIVNEYRSGRLPLFHFDVYRLCDSEELLEIGFEEYIHSGGVCVIEWADLVPDILPEESIYISLSYGEGEEERRCSFGGLL